jgi:deferrochelatase/peroxidase EfeB
MSEERKRGQDRAAPSRRAILTGLGAAGIGALAPARPRAESMQEPEGRSPEAARQAQPFYGPHQAGVTTPVPAAALVAAFDVLAQARPDLDRLMRTLTERIAFLMAGGTPPPLDPKFPPSDSGVLGPEVVPDDLTVTVAVGASLFDERFGLGSVMPSHLQRMRRFPNDALEPDSCHGDILLQICSNTPQANVHALRDIIKHTPDLLGLRWKIDGFLPVAAGADGRRETARNLLGFKDGTANPDPANAKAMDQFVWLRSGDPTEPAWAAGGTYQVVRIIRNFVERWDRTPLGEQQAIMGRDKASGAPLGKADEHDDPDYASDPHGQRIRLDAHIRLANPHTSQSLAARILRRGFNYSRGITRSGQLDMGLLFVCFQADLDAGFIAIQERLNGEPLEEYIKPTGGGYFFVLPGVRDAGGYLGEGMLAAST